MSKSSSKPAPAQIQSQSTSFTSKHQVKTESKPKQSKPEPIPKRPEGTLSSEVLTSAPLSTAGPDPDTARTAAEDRSSDNSGSDSDPSTSDEESDSDSDSDSESDINSHSGTGTGTESESENENESSSGSASEDSNDESEAQDSTSETEVRESTNTPAIKQDKQQQKGSIEKEREAGAKKKRNIDRPSSEVGSESGSGSDDSGESESNGASESDGSEGTADSSGSDESSSGEESDSASGSDTASDSERPIKKISGTKSTNGKGPQKDNTKLSGSIDKGDKVATGNPSLKRTKTTGEKVVLGSEIGADEEAGKKRSKNKERNRRPSEDKADSTKDSAADPQEDLGEGELKRKRRKKASADEQEKEGQDSDTGVGVTKSPPVRVTTKRNMQQNMIRYASLYLVPVPLSIPISLLLSLNISLLTPLYNTTPLTLHKPELYAFYLIPPSVTYWYITLSASAKDRISARVCFSIAALSGDAVVVCGRRLGSIMGKMLGPEWGAVASRAVLGLGVVGGGTGFALLCFDHISPIPPVTKMSDRPRNMGSVLYRTAFFLAHVYAGETFWTSYLSGDVNMLNTSPEKTILFISLLLTLLSLFLRPGSSTTPFSTQVHTVITSSLGVSPRASKALSRITTQLPRQAFPILLLLRIPLLILALRQQIFLRPPAGQPYVTANGDLRIISSERSLTGQIVVAENLKDGYRFLRADHSILGGRWIREVSDQSATGGKRTEMGDSIFATFNLQEVAVLAQRSDPSESLAKTLSLTTDLEVSLEGGEEDEEEDEKGPDRALIIGLGAGIAASSFTKRGMYVDVVEIDPAVYLAAQKHFELPHDHLASTNILDGASFINQLAAMKRANETELDPDRIPTWDIVVQDCFTGGSVPGEMFTLDFWEDLGDLMKDDGIVAMNFAGILKSKASKAVLVTLLTGFPQCRAFGDGFEKDQGPNDLVNMVVFCTKAHSPLLTFRKPTRQDALRSPLRAHVYSTFHPHEIQLDSIVTEADFQDSQLLLRRESNGKGQAQRDMDRWQVGSGMATWRAMQKILTPAMWLAY
ncbi:hypothetical protein IAT40_006301 [Kwoniella sp. CBS 6097]